MPTPRRRDDGPVSSPDARADIASPVALPQGAPMRTLALALLLCSAAAEGSAACYADYKAKRDDPLRLHYGVIELADADCASAAAAAAAIRARLGDGWQLLQVVGTFGESGLDERRAGAGDYFLRY